MARFAHAFAALTMAAAFPSAAAVSTAAVSTAAVSTGAVSTANGSEAAAAPATVSRSVGGAVAVATVSARIVRSAAAVGAGRGAPAPHMIARHATVTAADGRLVPALVYDFE